ncbi:DUF6599 family protein [Bryocella elongata]|nr:DUF6599 family protein [Bryocella elongata]
MGWALGSNAQGTVAINEPKAPLLPASFGEWTTSAGSPSGTSSLSLTTVSKAALQECGPQRSAVHDYMRNGKTIHVEAIEFNDRTGAESAFSLVAKPDMKQGKAIGDLDSVGEDAILFRADASLVLVTPATEADLKTFAPLVATLPKAYGNTGIAPLLPSLAPKTNLVAGSLRYALGANTYAAQGGVIPAQSLEWDKSAEAITATYSGKGGRETLTVVSYPTPEIASAVTKRVQAQMPGLGPQFTNAKARRERILMVVASGPWTADDAQKLIDSVHLHEQLSVDKGSPPPDFNVEVHKTASLLVSITIFSGALMVAALVLAIFFGGGRALVRALRGKPPAVEAEFLSLHLDPQNAPAKFQSEK